MASYFRTITISNPGTFRVNIDAAIDGGISDARNVKIFNMFSLINVGERSGSGLCDLYHAWKENGFETPNIVETLDPDRITLTLDLKSEGNDGNREGIDGNIEGNKVLSKKEKDVLCIIKTEPALSAKKISDKIDISVSSVERALSGLRKKGYIAREGSTRGRWIILR